jgi:NlpC/P60 family putative phage cell wall peptidase
MCPETMPSLKHQSPKLTRDGIVTEARTWLGTPFMHQQSMRGIGVDCVGLILGVGRDLGLLQISPAEWAPFAAYTRKPNPARMRKAMGRFLAPSSCARGDLPAIGSIGWFGWRQELPMHLAIVAEYDGRPTMIHAFETMDRCVENSIDATWRTRVDTWWQYPGFED